MDDFEFLAVIEIPKSKRILCQAEGCGHSVYKRVHIIKKKNVTGVYGSECAKKIFGTWLKSETPSLTSISGVKLSDSDLDLLRENTEKLLEKLRADYSKPEIFEISKAVNKPSNNTIHPNVGANKYEISESNVITSNPEISDRMKWHIEQTHENSKKGKRGAAWDLAYLLQKYNLVVRDGVIFDRSKNDL